MTVYLKNATRRSGLNANAIRSDVEHLLDAVGEKHSSISLSFVRDEAIRKLNRDFRGQDRATDVLSFPLVTAGEQRGPSERLLGDVVISVDTAARQAAGYDATLATEIRRLLIHGLLHLMGHDHERDDERVAMEREERRLADAIGMPWPY
jgi:probable rRNA maturation factor